MDLNEQAERSLNALAVEVGSIGAVDTRAAKMIWLEGYRAGMVATQAMAETAFAQLKADLA